MYDIIVIGDDLSSHVAAATASWHGLKTLLVAETGTGGLNVLDDFVFNLDPVPATGLDPKQPAGKILVRLGVSLPDGHEKPLNPAYQIILPGHRLDFFSDPGELADRGGLAGSVGPHQAVQLPLGDRQVQPANRGALFLAWVLF